jgi:hypothetical protein
MMLFSTVSHDPKFAEAIATRSDCWPFASEAFDAAAVCLLHSGLVVM